MTESVNVTVSELDGIPYDALKAAHGFPLSDMLTAETAARLRELVARDES